MKSRHVLAWLPSLIVVALMPAVPAWADITSKNEPRLKAFFEKNPKADTDKDGVLTLSEAKAYLQARRGSAAGAGRPRQNAKLYKPTADELDKILAEAQARASGQRALSYPKGNGLRIVSTGHSWVAPAMKTFPNIAVAAGLDGHRQRKHLSGGGSGSANSRWLVEVGEGGRAANPVLLSAIATGQWDVMTWGLYYDDRPEFFAQWIDVCLKYSPDMVFYLQDAWPRANPTSRKEKDLTLDGFTERQQELNTVVAGLIEALNKKYPDKVRVIPVGNAMMEMLKLYYADDLPGIEGLSQHLNGKSNSIWRDGGHLSQQMAWWEGYVYYAAIYKKSPELIDAEFDVTRYNKQLDQRMRQSAWRAVVDHPHCGVTDDNKNGIADEIE